MGMADITYTLTLDDLFWAIKSEEEMKFSYIGKQYKGIVFGIVKREKKNVNGLLLVSITLDVVEVDGEPLEIKDRFGIQLPISVKP